MPEDAAIRECLEETGIKIKLISERPDIPTGLIRPVGIEFNKVSYPLNSHLDFIYFGVPISNRRYK
jgi:8-oxo-dGTP pyrophosphatase MutT (NUDIX family)